MRAFVTSLVVCLAAVGLSSQQGTPKDGGSPERDPEISVLLEDDDVWRPKDVATLWWAGSAG